MSLSLSRNTPRGDLRAAAARPTWKGGDYDATGQALQVVSEELCETVNLCQDQSVLDVTAGGYHAAMAASRRWCDVTATEVPSDLARHARQRAEASATGVRFVDADADALPFGDQSFDAVISAFGAMFAQDEERAASEMVRVCRRGHHIGLANWTPRGFVGRLLALLGEATPGAGKPICAWGTPERLRELFGVYGDVRSTVRTVVFRARTPMDWVDTLRTHHLAAARAFGGLDVDGKRALRGRLLELVGQFDRSTGPAMVLEAEYLEVVVRRR